MEDRQRTVGQRHSNVFNEIHDGLPRQGPGNAASTAKAFAMLGGLPVGAKILDIGCGPGLQTVELAKLSGGEVVGFDIVQTSLSEHAAKASLSERIRVMVGSMFVLPFTGENFDAIWSEGAIYIIGFEKGLKDWRPLLKPEGYMVASHLSWLKLEVPDEPKAFWAKNYPAITTIDDNLKIAEGAGYRCVGHFMLPPSGWWDAYYLPLERNLRKLRGKYRDDQQALTEINGAQEEIDLYRKHSAYYGYVFYVLQKSAAKPIRADRAGSRPRE